MSLGQTVAILFVVGSHIDLGNFFQERPPNVLVIACTDIRFPCDQLQHVQATAFWLPAVTANQVA